MPTLIKPMSDIHLEFGWFNIVAHKQDIDKDTILILAGDIGLVHKKTHLSEYKNFLIICCQQFKEVILVFGNHEHYYGSILRTEDKLYKAFGTDLPHNLFILNRKAVIFDDIAFLGATLWTSGGRGDPLAEIDWKLMYDSKIIRTGTTTLPYDRKFYYRDMLKEHQQDWSWLREETKRQHNEGRAVVWVNHHPISFKSIPDRFKGHNLNCFYCSPELEEDILELEPEIIIHGHTHNSSNYMIETTLVICNPRGYHNNSNNPEFKPGLLIEL